MSRLLEDGTSRLLEDGSLRLLEANELSDASLLLISAHWRFSLPEEQWQMEPET